MKTLNNFELNAISGGTVNHQFCVDAYEIDIKFCNMDFEICIAFNKIIDDNGTRLIQLAQPENCQETEKKCTTNALKKLAKCE